MDNLIKIFDFIQVVWNLKNTYRWCKTGDWRQESTAEHTWRLAMMAILLVRELKLDIDVEKALKIAIVHDIAESLTWDIDAAEIHKNWWQEQKNRNETEAMNSLMQMLPIELWKEIFDLWIEYEMHETQESKFIKALDKLETHTWVIETWHESFDDSHVDFTVHYCDKCVSEFPALIPYYRILKWKLKEEYAKWWFEWKEGYDDIRE
ncbi:MAG: hypothetical protein ACD_2C00139G0001 [uncultured bacterium (gcode 4)]|uniref:5'-deoxynucleotidase n=1 Tax=uncultured bacterium (gcode 4) TaxID=1234023 RepID=K2G324_9BACT|nr:MAG: hypothetical protein ACD_2C00139G0001 [uncultured bacterium (gcode 4)]